MGETDLLKIARFPLPDNWEPEGTVCALVRIPADQQYFSALIGLLDMLKWSRNFARDGTHTGAAIVSRTWQAALESEPVRIVACDCGEDGLMFDMRVKPSEPWITQVSTDGGLTWHDAIIQPHWESGAGGEVPPGSQWNNAAIYMRNWYIWIIQQFQYAITNNFNRQQTINYVVNQWNTYLPPAGDVESAVGTAYDEFNATGPDPDYADECKWIAEFVDLSKEIDGTQNPLDKLSNWLNATLNTWSDALKRALNAAALALGASSSWFFANESGGGGGAGFGAGDCGIYYIVGPQELGLEVQPSEPAHFECTLATWDIPAGKRMAGVLIFAYASTSSYPGESARISTDEDRCDAIGLTRLYGTTSRAFGDGPKWFGVRVQGNSPITFFDDMGMDFYQTWNENDNVAFDGPTTVVNGIEVLSSDLVNPRVMVMQASVWAVYTDIP